MKVGRPWGALIFAGMLLALGACGVLDQNSGCVDPTLTVTPTVAGPGQVVTVKGQNYLLACDDTSGNGRSSQSQAMVVTVSITQDGTAQKLADVRSDQRKGSFSVKVTIPANLHAGSARIVTGTLYEVPAELAVTG